MSLYMEKLMETRSLSMIFCEGWKPSVHARVIAYKNETCWPSRIALLICSNTYYRSSCSSTVGWNILLTFNIFSCLSCWLQFRANSILQFWSSLQVIRGMSGSHQIYNVQSSGMQRAVVSQLLSIHQVVVRQSLGSSQAVVKQLSNSCQAVVNYNVIICSIEIQTKIRKE